jgi:hypothetical protein
MHVYVISPAAPLFLVHPRYPPVRAFIPPAGFSARIARPGMTRRYKEVGRVKSVSAVSIRTRTRGAWDKFAAGPCGETQAFDSV